MKKLIQQIMKFGVVGFVCFFIDYGIMVALKELLGIRPVAASAISFTVSVIINYILSVKLVFETDENADKRKEFVLFVVLSVIGLGITSLIMWILPDVMGVDYRIAKIGATAIVMVYNFITRKMFLEKNRI